MDFRKQMPSCSDANKVDLVDYLANLGYKPLKIRGNDYWYLSPLRNENTASFKVNRTLNVWYDHGIGQGGNLVDFGILYYACSVSEFLGQIGNFKSIVPRKIAVNNEDRAAPKIMVSYSRELTDVSLFLYLRERCILPEVALRYCKEIVYDFGGRKFTALGFCNDSSGWEVRNRYFKGSSSPKDITHIKNGSKKLLVFEGFFDLLSYLSMTAKMDVPVQDFLVLNGIAFAPRLAGLIDAYETIRLFLDNDPAGRKCTAELLKLGGQLKDEGSSYGGYKDLNDFLVSSYIGRGTAI